MTKFLVELDLDGYENEEEHDKVCLEFIEEQLNFAASSVKVTPINSEKIEMLKFLEYASKEVAKMPDWKKGILEASSRSSNDYERKA